MISKYADIQDFKLHYLEAGQGNTLLIIPSLGLTSRSYESFGEEFSKKYHVFIPDLAKGKTSGKKLIHSLKEYRKLLHLFIQKTNIHNFNLIGISLGGIIAAKYYETYPNEVKTLLLISSTVLPIKGNVTYFIKSYLMLIYKNLFRRHGLSVNLAWFIDGLGYSLRHPRQLYLECRVGIQNLDARIKEIKIPHILMVAEDDEFVKPQFITEMMKIKNLNLELVKNGHGWFFLKPKEFITKILNFLELSNNG